MLVCVSYSTTFVSAVVILFVWVCLEDILVWGLVPLVSCEFLGEWLWCLAWLWEAFFGRARVLSLFEMGLKPPLLHTLCAWLRLRMRLCSFAMRQGLQRYWWVAELMGNLMRCGASAGEMPISLTCHQFWAYLALFCIYLLWLFLSSQEGCVIPSYTSVDSYTNGSCRLRRGDSSITCEHIIEMTTAWIIAVWPI